MTGQFARSGRLGTGPDELSARKRYTTEEFLKERIEICQGQLYGMLLLGAGGAYVSSLQYPLIFNDLQLILAPMGGSPRGCLFCSRNSSPGSPMGQTQRSGPRTRYRPRPSRE